MAEPTPVLHHPHFQEGTPHKEPKSLTSCNFGPLVKPTVPTAQNPPIFVPTQKKKHRLKGKAHTDLCSSSSSSNAGVSHSQLWHNQNLSGEEIQQGTDHWM